MEKNKIFTVAIIGCGSRGCEAYGRLMFDQKDRYKIVALCDVLPEKVQKYGNIFGVEEQNLFTDEKVFLSQKRADLLVVATLDDSHVRICLEGLKLGYDLLLEKPITDKKQDCLALLDAQKRYGGKVLVCHVLRYAYGYMKLAEILDSGVIGRLVAIDATEQVVYWHQAHSYVRGNWRREEDAAPMILAKCCHDLDLLQFYAKSKCKSVSSVGDLTYFNSQNKPDCSADRCTKCKLVDTCPYSAKRIYIDMWKSRKCPENAWPFNILTPEIPLTEEALYKAIENGPYGRCVFACDNDVVDHQFTQITFENGVKASLLMTAFTAKAGRIIKLFGTDGEVVFDEENDLIWVKPFGGEVEKRDVKPPKKDGLGHGGGDGGIVDNLYGMLTGEASERTSLTASVESHLMGICAEQSRKEGGKLVFVHE